MAPSIAAKKKLITRQVSVGFDRDAIHSLALRVLYSKSFGCKSIRRDFGAETTKLTTDGADDPQWGCWPTLSDGHRPKSKVVELLSELSIGASSQSSTAESRKYQDLSAVLKATKRWRWLPQFVVNLRPNTSSNPHAPKSKFVELFTGYRLAYSELNFHRKLPPK